MCVCVFLCVPSLIWGVYKVELRYIKNYEELQLLLLFLGIAQMWRFHCESWRLIEIRISCCFCCDSWRLYENRISCWGL
jgi:hypothetical protein